MHCIYRKSCLRDKKRNVQAKYGNNPPKPTAQEEEEIRKREEKKTGLRPHTHNFFFIHILCLEIYRND